MVTHITNYQAGFFEGLVSEWPACQNWDVNTEEGVSYLTSKFGEDYLLTTLSSDSYLYGTFRQQATKDIDTFQNIILSMNKKVTQNKYKTQGGLKDGSEIQLLLNQEIPPALETDVIEPEVTGQLLDLQSTSFSVLKQGSISAAES